MATSLLQSLQSERDELATEEQSIITAAERAGSFTDAQRTRLAEIGDRIGAIEPDVSRLVAARERQRSEREIEATEIGLEAAGKAAANAPTPFRSLGEQLAAVAAAALHPHRGVDPRLTQINAAASGANELIGSEGGFLVQTDFAAGLLEDVYETGVLASETDRRPVGANANGMKMNVVDETSRADGSRGGGVRAYWTGEAGSLTSSKPKYAQLQLALQKLTGLYYATDEELSDATNLEANVTKAFADEFGFKVDDAIVRGSGAGMPLGWLNSAGTVSISKETGQAAATIISENVEKMYARMKARSIGKAKWFINQDCWPQLFQLAHVIGTGGVPMYIPAGGLSGAPFGTLLGRPVQPIEQADTLGTVGDINFVDLSEYLLIEKGGIAAATSIHVAFTTDETAFRWVLRTNGRPKREAPVTPFKGSATQSSFITLATRS